VSGRVNRGKTLTMRGGCMVLFLSFLWTLDYMIHENTHNFPNMFYNESEKATC